MNNVYTYDNKPVNVQKNKENETLILLNNLLLQYVHQKLRGLAPLQEVHIDMWMPWSADIYLRRCDVRVLSRAGAV